MLDLLLRILRHFVSPFTTWLVAKGLLPEAAQGDLTEFLILAIGFIVPVLWSDLRDRYQKWRS